jgi:hypothetical protein
MITKNFTTGEVENIRRTKYKECYKAVRGCKGMELVSAIYKKAEEDE